MDMFGEVQRLREHWRVLNDLEKGRALQGIRGLGMKSREIASLLGRSKEMVNYVLLVPRLPEADKAEIAKGASARRFIAAYRRRNTARKVAVQKTREAYRAVAMERGIKAMHFFFKETQISACYQETVTIDALARHRGEMIARKKPFKAKFWTGNMKAALQNAKPAGLDQLNGIDLINGWIDWLGTYAGILMPGDTVREDVLARAVAESGRLGMRPNLVF
jgi:hypothetical protein